MLNIQRFTVCVFYNGLLALESPSSSWKTLLWGQLLLLVHLIDSQTVPRQYLLLKIEGLNTHTKSLHRELFQKGENWTFAI